ncbi:MAG: outer membrane protein assembly factor BamA [Spongiibacteraceae bacterium]|jgi:outer membrane protein insertion porin family|nr:outer membrane protein assembly factor BamA [Spongiibacteraceae bacterium]
MKRLCSFLLLLSLAWPLISQEALVISDIRVEGLQRISAGSVFAAMPINVGDRLDQFAVRDAIRSLFRTGNFDDIQIQLEGTVLVVLVQERPSISEIKIEGNKAIETKALLEGLKKAGLAEGQVFKRSTLEGMRMELARQYVSQGRYDASIDTDVSAQPRNRVAINIDIDEGSTAAIKHIGIIGNSVYDDKLLLDEFELKSTGWFSWISGNDKYAREKLRGDLEKLNSYYLDRGYIQFNVDSTQVSITPERDAVYISTNVSEGEKYTVGKVDLSGDIVLSEEELRPFVLVQPGQTFSQALVTNTEDLLTKRLGNEGYNFAKVSGIPDVDEETKTVDIKLFVDPGKRTYVRRISFRGNNRTADEVLRREMRQMESAPASSAQIELSRIRLERLGFFKEAKIQTDEVPGTDDMIDLQYSVEEQPSGSIGASIGFSQDSGILLGANLQQNNFLGTGKQVGIGVNKSNYLTNIRFSYVNPYFTEDGVSRGFSVFYRKADLEEINVASYTTDTIGASLSFGYPIKETQQLGFAFTLSNTEIQAGIGAVQEIIASPRTIKGVGSYYTSEFNTTTGLYNNPEVLQPFDAMANSGLLADGVAPGFLDLYGDDYNNLTTTLSWTQSTLNRGQLATRGASQSVAFEISVPGSDLEYWKLTYNGQIFFPLTQSLTLRLRTELGYGGGYGDLEHLPFYENFFGGGFGSVRGFKSNTLGPRSTPANLYRLGVATTGLVGDANDTDCGGDADSNGICDSSGRVIGTARTRAGEFSYVVDPNTGKIIVDPDYNDDDPFGGDVLVEVGAELLFPLPFIKDQRSLRTAFFIDGGNVFSTNCGASQLNCSNVDFNELRYSVGFGLTWISGFGPLTFSVAKALNAGDRDRTEFFQFSLGRGF